MRSDEQILIRRSFARFLRKIQDLKGASEQYMIMVSIDSNDCIECDFGNDNVPKSKFDKMKSTIEECQRYEIHNEFAEFLWKYKEDYKESIKQCNLVIEWFDSVSSVNEPTQWQKEIQLCVWYHKAMALYLSKKKTSII